METNDITNKKNIHKPRNPFIALLLSLVTPGLGQVYNGQLIKGISFYLILILIPVIIGITKIITFFYGLVFILLIVVAFQIFIVVDAYRQAKQKKEFHPTKYNKWYYHLLIAVIMIAITWQLDMANVIGSQTFNIPTISQSPTIMPGDMLMADMRAYKNTEPDYGHIVVFTIPDGQTWTFTVVGLPNDRLDLIDNIISINGISSKSTLVGKTTIDGMSVIEFIEELPNGHKHNIYKSSHPYDTTKANFRNVIVPDGCYYLLGDNRDNAFDSRYIEAINIVDIKGRILYCYWGHSNTRINIDFRQE